MTQSSSAPGDAKSVIDITVAHSPRIWNHWLGGKDNYSVDREVQFREIFPQIVDIARRRTFSCRRFG